jgi:S1-C subfamily serine protease
MFTAFVLQAALVLVPAPREKDDADKGPGYLGVGYTEDEGSFLIEEVYENSPAKKAGLMVGDRILKLGGQKPATMDAFVRLIVRTRPGTVLDTEILRGDEKKTIKVKIGVRPTELALPMEEPKDSTPPPPKDVPKK